MKHFILRYLSKTVFVLCVFLSAGLSSAQSIWTNPITGPAPSLFNPFTTGDVHDAGITVSGIGMGSGIAGNAGADRYNATSWTPSSASVVADEYFEFTLTPATGSSVNFVNFLFTCQRSSTGPVNGVLRSSLDNFTSDIFSFSLPMGVSSQTAGLAGAAFQDIDTPITFRLYLYGTPANGNTGTASINDFTFNGTVLTECGTITPPAAAPQSFCNTATVGELLPAGPGIKWYAATTGGNPLSGDENIASGIYYVAQISGNCESERTAVAVEVIIPTLPSGESVQEFTAGETLADLDITGDNIVWYADGQMTVTLPGTTLLVNGTAYYAAAVSGVCTSALLQILASEVLSVSDFASPGPACYPNPVRDILNITYPKTIDFILVYNLSGQEILKIQPNAMNPQVDMSALPTGAYLVKVKSSNVCTSVKIIKK